MHSFGTLQHCCCLQSTWLPWPYTLPLILCGNCCNTSCEICMQAERLRWHCVLHSPTDHFFLFFGRFSVTVSFSPSLHCPLLPPLSCYDSSHRGQCWSLTDRQSGCLFGLFCCSRDICSNTWPFLAVQHKKLFLFIRTIFKKKNKFQVKNICHHILYSLRPNYSSSIKYTFSGVTLKYTTSSSKIAAYYRVIVYFTIWSVWCTE